MIGVTLDKYDVLQKVGEGGMATVYRGRHNTLDRHVAIKVLHPHLSSSTRNRKRFAREARAIEHLHHDNILEIYDYSGVDSSECYIITEFVEGDTLTALLHDRGRLPSEVVAIIGLRLTRALAYAHREGILHRDIKPDNVMIRVDGTVKLMDFGIARFLDESQVTMTGALVGSPAFMSPEQAKEGKLDQRSDLFSLGTTLYYLVAGSLPFSGTNASLILKNVIESNRPAIQEVAPDVSGTFADVIERLMATNPDDRYATADDVVAAIVSSLDESGVDPDEERWSLRRYLDDPAAYEAALNQHLQALLLLRGKDRLAAGDHLAALRLFNRLLAMDEQNAEVLALVQGLHAEPTGKVGGRALLVAALVLFVLGLAGMGWALTHRTQRVTSVPEPDLAPVAVIAATPRPAPAPIPVAPGPSDPPQPGPDVSPAPAPVPAPSAAPVPGQRTVVGERQPPAPAPGLDDEPGTLFVRVPQYRGRIYVDGISQGTTLDGQPIKLPPGTHEVEIRDALIETWTGEVTISPGEPHDLHATLVLRPVPVEFPRGWDGACVVDLDGAANPQGRLDQLQYRVAVKHPDKPHVLGLSCPGAERIEQSFREIDPIGTSFRSPP